MVQVTVISKTETFTVKGLLTKIEEAGITAQYVPCKVDEVNARARDSQVFVLLADDSAREMFQTAAFLKDISVDDEKSIILVGTGNDARTFSQDVYPNGKWIFFERPIDLPRVIAKIIELLALVDLGFIRKEILVIDDDPSYCMTIRGWLKDSYKVAMVNSGTQAITYLANNHADLILLDYDMPITPGPVVYQMLKSEHSLDNIPIMFLTGKNDRDSILKVLELHPADYLLKATIDRETLLRKVSNYFEHEAEED